MLPLPLRDAIDALRAAGLEADAILERLAAAANPATTSPTMAAEPSPIGAATEGARAAAEAWGVADLGDTQLDLARQSRCGFPEVVYAAGKSTATLVEIFRTFAARGTGGLATRVSPEQAAALVAAFPAGASNALARTFRLGRSHGAGAASGRVAVVTAGTSDLPVAEEARETLDWMGVDVRLVQDVGVAGPQRLLARLDELRAADCVVVVAGMEGALPSVVGGHVACPVIGVPTSVGYGANFGGVSALLSMLNSCAANVAVVNIDAGFKGGYLAGMVARAAARSRTA